MDKVTLYSQLPPPRHGSAVATQILMEVLQEHGIHPVLLDRRFSSSAAQVGKGLLRKTLLVPSLILRTARLGRAEGPVVFFTTNRPGSFLIDCLVRAVLMLRRRTVIHYVHTFGYARLAARGAIWRQLVKFLFSGADSVVCLSERHVEDIRSVVSNLPTVVIANTVQDLGRPRPGDGHTRFVYFASLMPEKGVLEFIEVATIIGGKQVEAKFEVWGAPANDEVLAKLLAAENQLENLCYKGEAITPDDKVVALSGASALLYPSTYQYEAQPLAIIEAMSLGTPTIAYSVGAIPELIDSQNGFVVTDIDEMVERVELLCLDTSLAAGLHLTTFQAFVARHSRRVFSTQWMKVLSCADSSAE